MSKKRAHSLDPSMGSFKAIRRPSHLRVWHMDWLCRRSAFVDQIWMPFLKGKHYGIIKHPQITDKTQLAEVSGHGRGSPLFRPLYQLPLRFVSGRRVSDSFRSNLNQHLSGATGGGRKSPRINRRGVVRDPEAAGRGRSDNRVHPGCQGF